MPDRVVWGQFVIRTYRDPAAGDARRVVFEPRDPLPGGTPAAVVLPAGGDLLVRYDPPRPAVPGLGRDDFLRKAAAVVRGLPGA